MKKSDVFLLVTLCVLARMLLELLSEPDCPKIHVHVDLADLDGERDQTVAGFYSAWDPYPGT